MLAPARAPYGPLLTARQVAVETWIRPRVWDIRGLGDLRRVFTLFEPDLVSLRGGTVNVPCLLALAGTPARTLVFVDLFEGDPAPGFVQRSVAASKHIAGFVCDLEASFQEHIQAARLTMIPPGHDPQWYAEGPELARFGVPERAFTVGVLATQPGDQQVQLVVEAARWLPMDLPIHFLLVAHHDDHDSLRRRIRRNPFPQRFHLTDDIGAAPGLMARCNVLVALRWNSEPLRRTVLHCMHHGVPIMAEDGALVRQIIKSDVNGLIVPHDESGALADGLAEFYERPARRVRLSENARREAAARFSMDRVVQQTHAVLEKALPVADGMSA